MIITFSTRFDRVTMFGEPALELLAMLGHSGTVPGAVLAADLPGAIRALRSRLAESGHVSSPAPAAPGGSGDPDESRPVEPSIDLATRAVPLIAMIERAIAGGSDLMWDRS